MMFVREKGEEEAFGRLGVGFWTMLNTVVFVQ